MGNTVRTWILAACASSSAALGSHASAKSTQKAPAAVIKLQCSGVVTDYDYNVHEVAASGIYVEIYGDKMKVFSIPSFPSYQDGISLDVYKRNPSQIFGKTQDDSVHVSINRLSGDISAWHYYEHQDIRQARAHRMFEGKCTNMKPIF